MDPNAALVRLRKLVEDMYLHLPGPDILSTTPTEDTAAEVVDAFEALDGWLSKGGFAPEAWRSGPEVAARTVDELTTGVTIGGVDVYVRNTPGAVIVSVGIDDLPPGKSALIESFDGASWEHELP